MDDEFSKRDALAGISLGAGSGRTYALDAFDVAPAEKYPSGLPLQMRGGVPLLPPLSPARRLNLVAKRGLDLVLCVLALAALAPLLLGVAALIKLTSPGSSALRAISSRLWWRALSPAQIPHHACRSRRYVGRGADAGQ